MQIGQNAKYETTSVFRAAALKTLPLQVFHMERRNDTELYKWRVTVRVYVALTTGQLT